MTITISEKAPVSHAAGPQVRVTGARVLRAEWSKLWSLRSTWVTLALSVFFIVAFGIISATRYKAHAVAGGHFGHDFANSTALSLSLFGTNFGQLAFGVLGVLVTAGEYSTGMIRSTLAAVPRRLPVLWSKAFVVGLVALVAATVAVFAAFSVASADLTSTKAAMTFSHDGVVRSLVGAALYLGLVSVIGAALGSLLRSIAGALSVLVAILMLVPGLVSLLPDDWQINASKYFPSHAGEAMYALTQDSATLSPAAGLAVLVGWTILALAAASIRLARSDA